MHLFMKVRLLIFLCYSALSGGCKKFADAPKDTCFIPYVDFVAYNVNPSTLEVSFASITSYNGTITSHHWDFGDGSTFNGEIPPPHKYPAQNSSTSGNDYRITYSVTNECGEAHWTDSIKISRCLADVKFGYKLVNDSTVQFINGTQSATPVSYEWNFGDGTKSTNAGSITKTYAFDGSYTVVLKATNACGDNYYMATIPVCAKPVPKQKISAAGCATININASETKNGELYQWDFGNGTVLPAAPSASSTISYTYPQKGSYVVKLKVINKKGCDSATVSTPVTIEAAGMVPNNNWSYNSDDLDFNFSREAVTNATTYVWDFGDGTTASVQNPGKKTFASPGVYTLTLKAGNNCDEYSFTTSLNVPFYKTIRNAPASLRDVVAISEREIYFLTTKGRLYKTDTAGNWSDAIALPDALKFNNNTRLFKDINNNLWIYGREEVAKFNPSSLTWTSSFSVTGFDRKVTIDGISVDNNGNLWTVGDHEVRKNGTRIHASGNNQFSSIAFNPTTGTMWITASNRNGLFFVSVNGNRLTRVDVSGMTGGADNIKVHPNGDIYFTTGSGIVRTNSSGSFMASYTALTTNAVLGGTPQAFDFDSKGNIWAVHGGRLVKVPIDRSNNAKSYSFTPDLNNISAVAVLKLTDNDNDILLAKTSGNGAIQIK